MKKILIICLVVFSCNPIEQGFKGYDVIINKKESILFQFGKYEYSPDGKDSVWVKSLYDNNYDRVMELFEIKKPLDSMWNVYLFNAKKYDTFPLPTTSQLRKSLRQSKQFSKVIENVKL